MNDDVLVVGGIFDSLFRIKLNKAKVNWSKVAEGAGDMLDGVEPGVETTGNVDKFLFDAAKDAIGHWLLEQASPVNGPMVVGASGAEPALIALGRKRKPTRTKEEAEQVIRDAGITQFSLWLVLLVQFLPLAVDAIKWIKELLGK